MRHDATRRQFVNTSLGALAGSLLLRGQSLAEPFLPADPQATPPGTVIRAMKRTLEINGKAANVLGLLQPNGTQGLTTTENELFQVTIENQLPELTAIHWHGLHPPNNEDGVPGVTQPPIRAGASVFYNFPVKPAGTHWMHSHQGLQEVQLLAAPLIVHDPADRARDLQEVVVMLGDFSFTSPNEIYANLRSKAGKDKPPMKGSSGQAKAPMKPMAMKPDANDVNYDAYLANDQTLLDPEVVKVEKGGRVRLRIINSASGTNYFLDLGSLTGELIATDGMPVKPFRASRFPIAIAQRLDIVLEIPRDGGAFPILALRELAKEQTGIILATAGATVSKIPTSGSSPTGLLTLEQESQLSAVHSLSQRTPTVTTMLRLQGNMSRYQWMINDVAFNVENPSAEKAQVLVKCGQRAAIEFVNETPMSHPMHLHGHTFQVVAINGKRYSGPLRDTVLVPGNTNVTVELDAMNPGLWYVHCHILWHLAAGMAALLQYQA
jgi:FtsP/CotA-like multicopper oxidase with cupredoxin domain